MEDLLIMMREVIKSVEKAMKLLIIGCVREIQNSDSWRG